MIAFGKDFFKVTFMIRKIKVIMLFTLHVSCSISTPGTAVS